MPLPRAQVTVVLAMSADGKIADRDRSAARFSSSRDLAHLETQLAKVDGVLFGAATLRAYGTCLPIRQSRLLAQRCTNHQPEQPVQIVCTQSGDLDPQLRFFRQPVSRWLLTTETGAQRWSSQEEAFVQILPWLKASTDWRPILQQLYARGLKQLAVLGGGMLVASLVEQNLVDELYLTICPLLLGGKTAPTPVDGVGLPISAAIQLQLIDVKTVDQEVFLHYRR